MVPASEQSRKARRCVPRGLTARLASPARSCPSSVREWHVPCAISKSAGGQSPTGALTKMGLLTLFPRICFRSCAGTLSARARLALDQESAHPNSVAATKNRRPAKADLRFLVEVTGLEPTTSWSLTKRATKLRYTSMKSTSLLYRLFAVCQVIFSAFRQKIFLLRRFSSSAFAAPALPCTPSFAV